MGTQERKLRERERRRQAILDAAESLFFEMGLEKSTMDMLAEKTELSKGTLYLYFASKDQVYYAIHVRAKKLLCQYLAEAALKKGTGLQQVLAMGQAFLNFAKTYPNYFRAMAFYDLPGGSVAEEPWATEAHLYGLQGIDYCVRALKTGQKDGSIRMEIEANSMALVLVAQLKGLVMLMQSPPLGGAAEFNPAALEATMFDLVRAGLSR